MNGKQETIGDIVAEYRKDAHLMERHQLPEPTVGDLRILLDRIEAAADRLASKMNALSRDLWNGKKMGEFAFALALDSFESALSATTAPAKSKVESTQPKSGWNVPAALNFANTLANHGWTQTANADSASSCIYALCRMLKERGNAAAMREALAKAREVIKAMGGYWARETLPIIDAALSAPARNCNRFKTELDAQIAFLNEKWLISVNRESLLPRDDFNNWTDEMKRAYSAWLFATAEKGGNE